MDREIYLSHIKAGYVCGKEHTCGKKIDYKNSEKSGLTAEKLSIKYNKEMEAYPCVFCHGWHIGRKMSTEELQDLSTQFDQLSVPQEDKLRILFNALAFDFWSECYVGTLDTCWEDSQTEEVMSCCEDKVKDYRKQLENILREK